jgi:diaminopimelate decarboxylase
VPHCEYIRNISVEDLIQTYGSPLYVFDERTVIDTARRAKQAFKVAYPNTEFFWSYKTNYLKAICNIFHEEGWGAEVVSEFEYQKAMQAGVAEGNIIYNGPCKSRDSLTRALHRGALVQIDNWDELRVVEEIAATLSRPANVGIRAWIDTKLAPVWSKFGFDLASGEASRVAFRIVANENLKLHTLHTHIGTTILNPKAYTVATERLLELREIVFASTGYLPPCLNLGGGFPSQARLHVYDQPAKPIEDYAKAIAEPLNKLPRNKRPQLRLETGRHLIDDAGYLIATVGAVKNDSYIVDAGVHQANLAAWYRLDVLPARTIPQPARTVKLYGCLCMNTDVIRDAVDLPPLDVGDRLTLHPVGAYNLTQSMQFINLRPAVVLIGTEGATHVIRRREMLDDLERNEQVPPHLELKKNIRRNPTKASPTPEDRQLENAYVDPRIEYPCYKSFDDFIDVDRLKALDGYVRERLERRTNDLQFSTGPMLLNRNDSEVAGGKLIWLTKNKNNTSGIGSSYYDLDKPECWELSEDASRFPKVMDFIRTLPFKSTGRMIIMYDFSGKPVAAHHDHASMELSHEFIWFRPSLTKPFYMMNSRTKKRQYVSSYSAWFDTVNQFHGADAAPGFSISLRVDGTFTDEVRALIPLPTQNMASTAALWASIGDKQQS